MSRSLLRIATLCLALLAACGRDVTFVDPRAATDPADSTDDDSTIVVRGDLDITVTVAAEDSAIARALGFPGLALVGAAVTARRAGQPLHQGTTDSAGRVRFEGLITGPWTVSAVRVLTAEERAALPAGAEDVTGFAAGASVTVVEAGTAAAVPAYAGRGGTVVISEVFAVNLPTDGNSYATAQYIELANNSFETVYLDGVVVGFTYYSFWESNVGTCEQMGVWREDSLGIWARFFNSFPGRGTDHPLPPGGTVLIATDAIDHSQFVPSLPDLSGADFEFIGPADVDNPAVPNMLETGVAPLGDPIGHGLRFPSVLALFPFVAAPLDPDTLVSDVLIPDRVHVRVPRAAVLDVFMSRMTPEREAASPLVPCDRMIHPVFDLQNAELYDYTEVVGIRRRLFQALPDGRVILQRTRNSMADFETAPITPGRVP